MRLAPMPIYRVGQDPPAARHHSRRDQRGQDRAMARWHSYSQNARVTLCSSAVGRLTGRPNSPTVSTLGFMLLVSLVISAMLSAIGSYIDRVIPFGHVILRIIYLA